ncbi:hypothetical protein QHJ31_004577, partial [Escherichia coli]|nr:hypothetical protein [Escherichia coli]
MSQKYLIRIAELESQLRQKDQQLSLVEETKTFLRSALARAEEKIEEDEREGNDSNLLIVFYVQ